MYIGITNDLAKRVFEHKEGFIYGFTKKYNIKMLVYFEQTPDLYSALKREKQLKKWNRAWKIELIEKSNPDWQDLYGQLF